MLEALDRGNLFLVPLDDRRQWYRYHHLFADVLRARLARRATRPGARSCTGGRASGTRSTAIAPRRSATRWRAGDLARAADLVEVAIPAMNRSQQSATLRQWLEALPDEMVRARPVLSVAYATTLLEGGRVEGVEARLRDAERWLDTMADGRAGVAVLIDRDGRRG